MANIWRFILFVEVDDEPAIMQPRIIHPRINYHLNAAVFRQSFRVDVEVFNELERLISPYLIDTNKNHALSPRNQILTAFHFSGNDAQYHVNGLAHGISKSTVCRYIHRIYWLVTDKLLPLFVRWPTVSQRIARHFFNIAGFPHVKGVIDGTLIHIDAPSIDEPVGRDNKHSFI